MDLCELTIEPATPAELHVCADFWLAMFEEIGAIGRRDMHEDWRARFEAYFRRRIEAGEARFFVARAGNEVAGTAGAILADGYPYAIHGIRRGYIFGVRVSPAYRKRGLASRLTQAATAFLRDIGCARIRLHASAAGRATYERLGFVPTNEMELR